VIYCFKLILLVSVEINPEMKNGGNQHSCQQGINAHKIIEISIHLSRNSS